MLVAEGKLVLGHGADWETWSPLVAAHAEPRRQSRSILWTPDQLPRADAPDRIALGGAEIDLTGGVRVEPDGPALLTALREQLGLTVESTRGPAGRTG